MERPPVLYSMELLIIKYSSKDYTAAKINILLIQPDKGGEPHNQDSFLRINKEHKIFHFFINP